MANIKDFQAIFGTKSQEDATRYPTVLLDGWKFRLLNVGPYFGWHETGEKKPDGSPKWEQDTEMTLDETGERVRTSVQLQLVDPHGRTSSAAAPFEDNKRYFAADELQKLVAHIGDDVVLKRPRIEVRDVGETTKKGFARVTTRFVFAFDGFDFGDDEEVTANA